MKNKKSLSYYQSLDYEIKIEKDNCDDETWYIAYCDELGRGSCYGLGDTPEEALKQFMADKNDFIEELYKEGRPVPEPRHRDASEMEFSGVFNVRTTPLLHAHMSRLAKQSGVSLNHYVTQILAMGSMIGEVEEYFDKKCNAIEDKIDEHHYQMTTQMVDYQKHKVDTQKPIWDITVEYDENIMKIAS